MSAILAMAAFNIQEALIWKEKIELVIDQGSQVPIGNKYVSFEYKSGIDNGRKSSASDRESQLNLLHLAKVMHLGAEKEMMSQCVALLEKFIAVREPNIRYLGLETRMLMVSDVQDIIKRHQSQIITSLKDPDIRSRFVHHRPIQHWPRFLVGFKFEFVCDGKSQFDKVIHILKEKIFYVLMHACRPVKATTLMLRHDFWIYVFL
ncbi:hypothetical protein CsSME_00013939 [Camellia sinensis var. sinensis]